LLGQTVCYAHRLACCAMCSSICLLRNASISFAIYLLNSSNFYRPTPDYVAPNDFAGPVGCRVLNPAARGCSPVAYWLTEKKKRQPGLINGLSCLGVLWAGHYFFVPFQRCCDSMDCSRFVQLSLTHLANI
jgi:hypothetical protein